MEGTKGLGNHRCGVSGFIDAFRKGFEVEYFLALNLCLLVSAGSETDTCVTPVLVSCSQSKTACFLGMLQFCLPFVTDASVDT